MSSKKEGYFASIKRRDPAARHALQIIFLYPGVHAIFFYRIAHFFWKIHFKFLAESISFIVRHATGIEIHPGAKIGKHLFIDHGSGTIIGETTIIGNNVTMYHGVTLGGRNYEHVKRHPTIEDNVTIGCNATILGNITIGKNSRIGANSLVLKDVPADSVVFSPLSKVVFIDNKVNQEISK